MALDGYCTAAVFDISAAGDTDHPDSQVPTAGARRKSTHTPRATQTTVTGAWAMRGVTPTDRQIHLSARGMGACWSTTWPSLFSEASAWCPRTVGPLTSAAQFQLIHVATTYRGGNRVVVYTQTTMFCSLIHKKNIYSLINHCRGNMQIYRAY